MTTTTTPATEEQQIAHSVYSDTYKELYNIRPRWTRAYERTAEEWRALTEGLREEYHDRSDE